MFQQHFIEVKMLHFVEEEGLFFFVFQRVRSTLEAQKYLSFEKVSTSLSALIIKWLYIPIYLEQSPFTPTVWSSFY